MSTTRTASERITATVTEWQGVEAGFGRRGEWAFTVGGREIGHLHGDRVAHFGFPRDVGARLREEGRVGPHPVNPHSTKMAARPIDGEADVRDVIELMRLNYERVTGRRSGSAFSEAELAYLHGERRLGRLATVGKDGTPHVVPVGWTHDAEHDTIDVGGHDLAATKKYRDVARSGRAAIVIDDLASVTPWRPRGIEVRGRAEVVTAPAPLIRIHPERIVSWGLEPHRSARTVPQTA
jgi:pyridoxamine 5'-phosphate oxidase family protein